MSHLLLESARGEEQTSTFVNFKKILYTCWASVYSIPPERKAKKRYRQVKERKKERNKRQTKIKSKPL
jgi:hypothetical protein